MSINDILKNLDIDSLAPLLQTLGVNKSIIETLCTENFKNALSGNITIKELIPLLLPLLQTFLEKRKPYSTENSQECYTQTDFSNCEYLSPIKDIAGESITNALEKYFT